LHPRYDGQLQNTQAADILIANTYPIYSVIFTQVRTIQPPTSRRRTFLFAACIVAAIGMVAVLLFPGVDAEIEEALATAGNALKLHDWQAAEAAALQVVELGGTHSEAALILGEVATRQQKLNEALGWYQQVSRDEPEFAIPAAFASGEILRTTGRLSFAEQHYRETITLDSDHTAAHQRMVLILRLTGRPFEASSHQRFLIEAGQADPQVLLSLLDRTRVDAAVDYLEFCRNTAPEDSLPIFGLAAIAAGQGRPGEAALLWRQGLEISPDASEAIVSLASLLTLHDGDVDKSSNHELQELVAEAPASCRKIPEFWLLIAEVATQRERPDEANRYLAEAIRLDPNFKPAIYRLGANLVTSDPEAGNALLRRAEVLEQLEALGTLMNNESARPRAIPEVISKLSILGRGAEAEAWVQVAVAAGLDADSFRDSITVGEADGNWQETIAKIDRVSDEKFRHDSWWQTLDEHTVSNSDGLHFVDEAETANIDFQYFESPDPETEGRRMFEFTGGGVAILDFDMDGAPDIYFTQGTNWPVGSSEAWSDQLFRNVDHARFANATLDTNIRETGFSQGVAAGDFDSDGFPDLYVANFGRNRLFQNNGDGTFTEAAAALSFEPAWTTSCLIADLNGDQIADLYDVNYVEGSLVTSRICNTEAGPRVCTPQAFDAARDSLLLGTGDGNFTRVGKAAGLEDISGKGLGIVAANFDNDPQLELFIANDSERNNLLDLDSATGREPHYSDVALTAGLAFSADGKSQACMGVAAADLTGNGKPDLFVTNFYNESNALYQNRGELSFYDAAAESQIRSPSMRMLGFGTQAFDADLDGDVDIVVANGDIDDFEAVGRPFRMRPQIFVNDGSGKFHESISGNSKGYFSGESARCGRSLATLDWNGDGKMDFVVSNLGEPAALVTNRSAASGSSFTIKLVATGSHRDAIGTAVSMQRPDGDVSFQLSAGDGYQASNQRTLVVATKQDDKQLKLLATWPDGSASEITIPETGKRYVLVQGRAPVALP
jgi:tetratricopeptide (TPR) repeat protein